MIAGAAVMGAVFAVGVGTEDLGHADPAAIAAGMRLTFLLAGGLMIVASGVAVRHRTGAERAPGATPSVPVPQTPPAFRARNPRPPVGPRLIGPAEPAGHAGRP